MTPAHRPSRGLVPITLIAVWLVVGALLGPFAGRLGEVATNDQAAFLPRSAESTRVLREQSAFQQRETLPVIVLWTADDGKAVSGRQRTATAVMAGLTGEPGMAGSPSPALPSRDHAALQAVVPLRPDLGDRLAPTLERVRAAAEKVPGTQVRLAGPAATQTDLADAFSGIDGVLLAVALAAVLVILLLVYRSLLLPLVVIAGAVFALGLACAVVYALADHGLVRVDGQVQGILSILVIGAATDYALLVTARCREELTVGRDRYDAVRAAVRRSAPAVLASAGTVALGLIALLLSDLTNNRALGPVGAVGIACAALSALTFLPAALALLGRRAYWPARPGSAAGTAGLWQRVAGLVDRRPRRVWALALTGLLVCSAGALTLDSRGVPLDETFVRHVPSVAAQQTLARHFPAGAGTPVVVIADAASADRVERTVRDTAGVAAVTATGAQGRPAADPQAVNGRVRFEATAKAAPDTQTARDTVARLRTALHALPGAHARSGAYTAQQYDTLRAAERDRMVIVPVVLAVILIILVLLLRSLAVPVLLVLTVALNFTATLGVAALVFRDLFGLSGTDPSVPLYGFVFLVALGVDYNIFLMSRVREEMLRHGTREGIRRGLVTTGGVITSAGVVLAATFAALGVIPLAFLVQIAFIVAFGVLLDTLVVRSLLVPALVRDAGDRVWWPTGPGSAEADGRTAAAGRPVALPDQDRA
ncbi:MMPL family transporter [Streptomyces sp. SID4946]|nr:MULTISPECIES: MMPL family transporter [unclassified Streptomyces]MYQ93096.1 MMPL family transporter [Streptomyces sp. SID4946]SCF79031.1 putative drug exporter of the RND superfamily [Streptomyces sp. DconLS]